MPKQKTAKILLSVLVVVTTLVSIVADWNSSHVFSPDWPPHAKFHDIMLLTLLVGLLPLLLWLLWRKSSEPEVAVKVTTAILLIFWGSFYLNYLVPGTSPRAFPDVPPPSLWGVPLYPNMVVAAIIIVLSLVAYGLYSGGDKAIDKTEELQ